MILYIRADLSSSNPSTNSFTPTLHLTNTNKGQQSTFKTIIKMVQLSTLLVLAVSTMAVSSKPVAIDGNMSSAKLSLGTNAERIAQGMSPLPPTRRSTGM